MRNRSIFILVFLLGCVRGEVKHPQSMDTQFCSKWNPDFTFNGHQCCKRLVLHKNRRVIRCTPVRKNPNLCEEMTDDQKEYIYLVQAGKFDVLKELSSGYKEQAFCTVNDGFLAHGRPIVPTAYNRLQLFFPGRCSNFGTDAMVGMLEWVGRQVATHYPAPTYAGVHLLVADVTGPRGGCIWGLSGRTSHLSHTNGQDIDLGFLSVFKYKNSPVNLHSDFDVAANWWLLKKIFKNPFACIKKVFLDRRHIAALARYAHKDPEWPRIRAHLQHCGGHHNHFHIRIGNGPNQSSCRVHTSHGSESEAEETDEGSD